MISAKCAVGTDTTALSDGQGNILDNGELVRFAKLQGNATSPRGNLKAHWRQKEQRALGGTNNLLSAMFADEDPAKPRKMCRIITRHVDTHQWQNGVMVRTETRPEVTHTEIVENVPTLAFIAKRAQKMDVSPKEYCETIGLSLDEIVAYWVNNAA